MVLAVIVPMGLMVVLLQWLSYRPNSRGINLPVRRNTPPRLLLTAWLLRVLAVESAVFALPQTLAMSGSLLIVVPVVYVLLLVLTTMVFILLIYRAA